MSSILQKLMNVQAELNAPKNQTNTFGNYKYRSCEDIVEALKPILSKQKLALTMSDTPVCIGSRYYIEATATIYDCDVEGSISVSAVAREEEAKKGMDAAQITGSASSYARKYALNGLFAIDDAKDADTNEQRKQSDAISAFIMHQIDEINMLCDKHGINKTQLFASNGLCENTLTADQAKCLIHSIKKKFGDN